MEKQDGRRLKHEMLTELRKRAVAAVQAGESPEVVAKTYGVNRASVYGWLALYRQGGLGQLDAKKRGGRRTKLDGKALRWLYRTITEKDPLQLKFKFALWTARIIGEVIFQRFGIRLSKASVCRLLGQLGLSPQRPVWRAYQQKPEEVAHWLETEYPRIQRLAKRVKAQIFFGDEAGVRSDHHAGTTWAVKGKTPVVTGSTGARFGLNIISAVSAQGQLRFMIATGRVGAKEFIRFLKRLLHNAPGKIFLIIDGHPAHKAQVVYRYVQSVRKKLQLFFLPPYSPELNPDERVWNDLKNNALGRQAIASPKQLRQAVTGHLRFIQNTPDRVRAYFSNQATRYAAAF